MRARSGIAAAALVIAVTATSFVAAAKVDVFPTGLAGSSPRLAPAKDGSLHVLYYASAGLRHARLVSGAFVDDALLPDSGSVSRAKYNRPSLDVGPDSVPHVVWGPAANWTDATTHSKGVWYWNGSSTKQIFGDYTEYLALGVTSAGKKMFATAVVFLPGDTVGGGVGSAELKGDTLDPITRFSTADIEGKHVAFCKADDGALHLVWRMQKVRYARWDGSAWSAVEGLGANLPSSAELPSCAVDGKGEPHVAWLRWQDMGGGKWAPVDLRYAKKSAGAWAPSTEGEKVRALAAGGTSPGIAVSGDHVLIAWTEGSTLFSRLSSDGGATFAAAEAQVTDVDPGDDLGDNAPQLPLVVHEGKFQTVYARKDGTLVRAVWVPPAPPVVDAGADAAADASVDVGGVDVGGVDAAIDSAAPTYDGAAHPGSDILSSDEQGGCGCRVVRRRNASGAAFASLVLLATISRRRRALPRRASPS